MIKVIVSMPIDHENLVSESVEFLQKDNYTVDKIERIKKGFMFFSDAITYIYYRKLSKVDILV
jgi:hypothetical protein